MSATYKRAEAQLQALYARVLDGDVGAVQLWFSPDVLDRYRGLAGWRVMRTNSVGRVQSPEGWSLDFGISADESALHGAVGEFAQRLPAGERQHWLKHVLAPPTSRNFLTMRLVRGACIDDGDLRAW